MAQMRATSAKPANSSCAYNPARKNGRQAPCEYSAVLEEYTATVFIRICFHMKAAKQHRLRRKKLDYYSDFPGHTYNL